jgi:F0F1-type ATP synthase epsilon subunit
MHLQLISFNKGIEVDREIFHVKAEGQDGSLGILDNHVPTIVVLKQTAEVSFQTKRTNPVNKYRLDGGILAVTKDENNVTQVKISAKSIEKI